MNALMSVTLLIGLWAPLPAQSLRPTYSKVYTGEDGLAHLVNMAGEARTIPKEEKQVSIASPQLSPDQRSAGWLIEVENCCTSYTIPVTLEIYTATGKHLFGDGTMVYDWSFVPGNPQQVALSTGTVHGMTSRHLTLFSIRTGHLLQTWDGAPDAEAPVWAKSLKN